MMCVTHTLCAPSIYPQTWHKACFTCEVCKLKLTMKTYKGYDKLPYCNTHYPTTKFTSVSDTPENLRLKKQTEQQSDITYRKDREETLKKFTPVESLASTQSRQRQQLASNIGYHTAPHEQERVRGYEPPPPQASYHPPPQASYHPPPQAAPQIPPPMQHKAPAPPPPSGPKYVAIYDYAAADEDEVSFVEGDIMIDVTVIDDGWMEARVQRTGQYGMLPSNYVEKK
jgi:hypothetical protein